MPIFSTLGAFAQYFCRYIVDRPRKRTALAIPASAESVDKMIENTDPMLKIISLPRLIFLGLLAIALSGEAQAQEQASVQDADQQTQALGVGRLFNNDLIGDGRDRWRTGSYSISLLRGEAWDGALGSFGNGVVEYRFRGEVISPANLTTPAAGDRLYVGALSAGAHYHFDYAGYDISAGVDLVAMGEQTGLRGFHVDVHDALNQPVVNTQNFQIEDKFSLHGTLEVAREVTFGEATTLRPFIEVQGGVETLARAGFDLTLGSFGQGGMRLRDPVTGQRYSAIASDEDQGFSFLMGADVAHMDRSAYLPESRGYQIEETRYRARLGMNYVLDGFSTFYGVTRLSEEFIGQPEGQTVGSLALSWNF